MPGNISFLGGGGSYSQKMLFISFNGVRTDLASQSEFHHFSYKNRGGRCVRNIICLKGGGREQIVWEMCFDLNKVMHEKEQQFKKENYKWKQCQFKHMRHTSHT